MSFCNYSVCKSVCTGTRQLQGGRGHLAVYDTSPQTFEINFLIRWLNNFGDFHCELYRLVHLVECLNVSTTNCNIQKGLFCKSSLGLYSYCLKPYFKEKYLFWTFNLLVEMFDHCSFGTTKLNFNKSTQTFLANEGYKTLGNQDLCNERLYKDIFLSLDLIRIFDNIGPWL